RLVYGRSEFFDLCRGVALRFGIHGFELSRKTPVGAIAHSQLSQIRFARIVALEDLVEPSSMKRRVRVLHRILPPFLFLYFSIFYNTILCPKMQGLAPLNSCLAWLDEKATLRAFSLS
ncbi:MAG: hypothetical protein ACREGR_03630, partial [Minisyncoccia bacterium]